MYIYFSFKIYRFVIETWTPSFPSMIYYSDPHSPVDRFTQLLFPRCSEKWGVEEGRKAAYRVENPG